MLWVSVPHRGTEDPLGIKCSKHVGFRTLPEGLSYLLLYLEDHGDLVSRYLSSGHK